jgi:hypothetical protein
MQASLDSMFPSPRRSKILILVFFRPALDVTRRYGTQDRSRLPFSNRFPLCRNCQLVANLRTLTKLNAGRLELYQVSERDFRERCATQDQHDKARSPCCCRRPSDEHGHADISQAQRRYQVGERLSVVSNHVYRRIDMHDEIFGFRDNRVEAKWEVAARGNVR